MILIISTNQYTLLLRYLNFQRQEQCCQQQNLKKFLFASLFHAITEDQRNRCSSAISLNQKAFNDGQIVYFDYPFFQKFKINQREKFGKGDITYPQDSVGRIQVLYGISFKYEVKEYQASNETQMIRIRNTEIIKCSNYQTTRHIKDVISSIHQYFVLSHHKIEINPLRGSWVFEMVNFQPQNVDYKQQDITNMIFIPFIPNHSQQAHQITMEFSVGIIQSFKKKFYNQAMSFIFFLNNGFASMTTLEQVQGYYQNLGSFYSNNEEFIAYSNYSQTWGQTDPYPQNQMKPLLNTQAPQQETPIQSIRPSFLPEKPKRRMEKTLEKEILSAKKNSQSNIINQFYSFFSSRQKSERTVEKCCLLMGKTAQQVQKILTTFYMIIRFINAKRGRKYVNVSMFLKFFTPEDFGEYLSQMKEKIEHLDYLNLQELCQIFRRCAKYFLKEISIHAVLTSKRISVVSKEEHLKKRRKILRTVMGN